MTFRPRTLIICILVTLNFSVNSVVAHEFQVKTTQNPPIEEHKVTSKKPRKKTIQRKPDGTLGYRYTCSPSGFGQMGKCW